VKYSFSITVFSQYKRQSDTTAKSNFENSQLSKPDKAANALVKLSISGKAECLQAAAENANDARHKRKQLEHSRFCCVLQINTCLT